MVRDNNNISGDAAVAPSITSNDTTLSTATELLASMYTLTTNYYSPLAADASTASIPSTTTTTMTPTMTRPSSPLLSATSCELDSSLGGILHSKEGDDCNVNNNSGGGTNTDSSSSSSMLSSYYSSSSSVSSPAVPNTSIKHNNKHNNQPSRLQRNSSPHHHHRYRSRSPHNTHNTSTRGKARYRSRSPHNSNSYYHRSRSPHHRSRSPHHHHRHHHYNNQRLRSRSQGSDDRRMSYARRRQCSRSPYTRDNHNHIHHLRRSMPINTNHHQRQQHHPYQYHHQDGQSNNKKRSSQSHYNSSHNSSSSTTSSSYHPHSSSTSNSSGEVHDDEWNGKTKYYHRNRLHQATSSVFHSFFANHTFKKRHHNSVSSSSDDDEEGDHRSVIDDEESDGSMNDDDDDKNDDDYETTRSSSSNNSSVDGYGFETHPKMIPTFSRCHDEDSLASSHSSSSSYSDDTSDESITSAINSYNNSLLLYDSSSQMVSMQNIKKLRRLYNRLKMIVERKRRGIKKKVRVHHNINMPSVSDVMLLSGNACKKMMNKRRQLLHYNNDDHDYRCSSSDVGEKEFNKDDDDDDGSTMSYTHCPSSISDERGSYDISDRGGGYDDDDEGIRIIPSSSSLSSIVDNHIEDYDDNAVEKDDLEDSCYSPLENVRGMKKKKKKKRMYDNDSSSNDNNDDDDSSSTAALKHEEDNIRVADLLYENDRLYNKIAKLLEEREAILRQQQQQQQQQQQIFNIIMTPAPQEKRQDQDGVSLTVDNANDDVTTSSRSSADYGRLLTNEDVAASHNKVLNDIATLIAGIELPSSSSASANTMNIIQEQKDTTSNEVIKVVSKILSKRMVAMPSSKSSVREKKDKVNPLPMHHGEPANGKHAPHRTSSSDCSVISECTVLSSQSTTTNSSNVGAKNNIINEMSTNSLFDNGPSRPVTPASSRLFDSSDDTLDVVYEYYSNDEDEETSSTTPPREDVDIDIPPHGYYHRYSSSRSKDSSSWERSRGSKGSSSKEHSRSSRDSKSSCHGYHHQPHTNLQTPATAAASEKTKRQEDSTAFMMMNKPYTPNTSKFITTAAAEVGDDASPPSICSESTKEHKGISISIISRSNNRPVSSSHPSSSQENNCTTFFIPTLKKSQVDAVLEEQTQESRAIMESSIATHQHTNCVTSMNMKKKTKTKYQGEYNNIGQRHGYGIYKSKNGNEYRGEWQFNKREGLGVVKVGNGDVFEGQFISNLKNGVGVYHYSDGECDLSRYIDDVRVGDTIRYSKDRTHAHLLGGNLSKHISLEEAVAAAKTMGTIMA